MGFSNVAWESRSAERLARDLTDGPGPTSVGQAGAAWVRVADEWASIATEFGAVVEKIKGSFSSQGADAAARKLEELGAWLASVAVTAADNGERAEHAAVAYSAAVLGMPSVSEAVAARTTHDVMASLAAYNGAVMTGQFAEFDEVVGAHRSAASAVMYQYEEACGGVGEPWPQPAVPDAVKGAALTAERDAKAAEDKAKGAAAANGGGAGVMATPLASRMRRVAAATSGPMPSPGKTTMRIFLISLKAWSMDWKQPYRGTVRSREDEWFEPGNSAKQQASQAPFLRTSNADY